MANFNLMTLNLANYDDHADWDERLSIIVDTVTSNDADVIAVQEVRFDPRQPSTQTTYQNMAEQLVAALDASPGYAGMAIVTQPLMFYPDTQDHYPTANGQLWEGVSILSRLPILETGALFLPRVGSDANLRGTQYAAIAAGGSTVYVFNTHFALDAADRMSNAQQTLAYMARFAGPQFLVGDLNAIPSDPAIGALTDGGLTDVWASLQPSQPGYTWPSNDPSKRIDYIWVDSSAAAIAQSIQLVATKPDGNGVYASDHFGLLASIEV
jgi:beta-glucosidase